MFKLCTSKFLCNFFKLTTTNYSNQSTSPLESKDTYLWFKSSMTIHCLMVNGYSHRLFICGQAKRTRSESRKVQLNETILLVYYWIIFKQNKQSNTILGSGSLICWFTKIAVKCTSHFKNANVKVFCSESLTATALSLNHSCHAADMFVTKIITHPLIVNLLYYVL